MPVLAAEMSTIPIAASLLLLMYAAVLAILTPREISFLSGVAQPKRALFIVQDVLLQVWVLMVLVPALLLPRASTISDTRLALIVIIIGFTLLWITVVWMLIARQRYVHQLLRDATRESREQLAKLSTQLKQNQEENSE